MSKRLNRISSPAIAEKLLNAKGIELNAILQNGNTCFGKLVSVDAASLTIADKRQHEHKFAIADIFEIVFDFKS